MFYTGVGGDMQVSTALLAGSGRRWQVRSGLSETRMKGCLGAIDTPIYQPSISKMEGKVGGIGQEGTLRANMGFNNPEGCHLREK